ncbi:hypothetical protein CRYUN_Cryun20dG0105900 [Craigia yunnanensis]
MQVELSVFLACTIPNYLLSKAVVGLNGGSASEELGKSYQETSALKIVHAGGIVECYYMAIPAVNIMKYPSFVLARSEVFRRPWDSLVRSDEILPPELQLQLHSLEKIKNPKEEMGHDQEEETPPATPTTTDCKDQEEETWNHQKQTLILELSE